VCEGLGLSYNSSKQLDKLVDKLPQQPKFTRHEIVIEGELYELYSCNIVECLKALWGDPDFLPYLVFEPERHYADDDHTVRMVHDMHTGRWWWDTQVRLYSVFVWVAAYCLIEKCRKRDRKKGDHRCSSHHIIR